jgi:ATP-dependent DNA ligase
VISARGAPTCWNSTAVGVRRRTLIERKAMLRHLLNKADDHVLRFSEPFPDPVKLLAAAESQGLEGIVSKSATSPTARGRTSAG